LSVPSSQFEFVTFSPFLKTFGLFWQKMRILGGNRQTKKIFKKIQGWMFEMLLHTLAALKASNW
jgi:hypothetical protein